MGATSLLDRVRQPEYTGENRCLPCTVMNLVIAIVTCALVAVVSLPAAIVAFCLFVGIIALRGYLVPGTPTLTDRYFPRSVLRLFGKDPTVPSDDQVESADEASDRLFEAGILKECRTEDDLCLSEPFQKAWRDEIQTVAADLDPSADLAEVLDVSSDYLDVTAKGDVYFAALNRRQIGQWSSRAALIADVAAARILGRRFDDWNNTDLDVRGAMLTSLRLFLDRCPSCGGAIASEETTADPAAGESCCFSKTVLRHKCGQCGSVLFQTQAMK